MLPTLERLSNLKAKRPPVVRETDAAGLRAYLVERLEETYPGDLLRRLGTAYVWLGLLPDTLELRSLLLRLYEEQALGFYDPKREVLYVRRDAPVEALTTILAHELVHALQDQHVDLDALVRDWRNNDRHTAAQAAIEGHATLVMYAWRLEAESGRPIDWSEIPDLGPLIEQGTAAAAAQMPVYASAPRFIQQALIFPYAGGTEFVQRLWRRVPGRPPPYGPYLPTTTEQVLHGLESGPAVALGVAAPPGWSVASENDLGELEIRLFLRAHLSGGGQARAAAGWAGDRYALLTGPGGADTVFAWTTLWDTEADAAEFETAYRQAFRERFGGTGAARGAELVAARAWARVEAVTLAGRPGRRIVEARRPLPAEFLRGLRFEASRDAGRDTGSLVRSLVKLAAGDAVEASGLEKCLTGFGQRFRL